MSGVLCPWLRYFPHLELATSGQVWAWGGPILFYKKAEKSRCEEVVSDTMGLLPAVEGQQIIVFGQRKSGGGGGCAQCDQKGGILMTGGAHSERKFC